MTCFVELSNSINLMSDEQLLEAYKAKADDMSYFNAADGQSWYQEAAARGKCQEEFAKISEEIKKRGMVLPSGSWLI